MSLCPKQRDLLPGRSLRTGVTLTGQSFTAAGARSEESAALFHSLSLLPAQTVSGRSRPHRGPAALPFPERAPRAGPGPVLLPPPQSERVSPRRLRMKAAIRRCGRCWYSHSTSWDARIWSPSSRSRSATHTTAAAGGRSTVSSCPAPGGAGPPERALLPGPHGRSRGSAAPKPSGAAAARPGPGQEGREGSKPLVCPARTQVS